MITRPRDNAGFTLIEVLIVVVLISIIMATIVGSFAGVDREQEAQGIAARVALRIEMARDRAIQSNREWGVHVEQDSISFSTYDTPNEEWVARQERAFAQDNTDLDLTFNLDVELYPGMEETTDKDFPQIVLFSSGEVTPFTLEMGSTNSTTSHWQVSSDGFSQAKAERVEQ
jgi:general secretion pathway protein H